MVGYCCICDEVDGGMEGVFNTPRYAVKVSPTYTVNESGKHNADCNTEGFDSIMYSGPGDVGVVVTVLVLVLVPVVIDGTLYNNDGKDDDDMAWVMCSSGFCNRMTRNVGTADIMVIISSVWWWLMPVEYGEEGGGRCCCCGSG